MLKQGCPLLRFTSVAPVLKASPQQPVEGAGGVGGDDGGAYESGVERGEQVGVEQQFEDTFSEEEHQPSGGFWDSGAHEGGTHNWYELRCSRMRGRCVRGGKKYRPKIRYPDPPGKCLVGNPYIRPISPEIIGVSCNQHASLRSCRPINDSIRHFQP